MAKRLPGLGIAWLALIGVIILITLGPSPVLQGELHGPDPYSRLNRLFYNWTSGDWSNVNYPRSNWPLGELIHWTRALDLLILALAVPLLPFVGIQTALLTAGAISGPILHIVGVATAIWAAMPALRPLGRRWVGLFFVLQPAAGLAFMVGRPDHHGLQLVVWMALLGITARLVGGGSTRPWLPITGGMLFAAGVWISIEQLVAAAPFVVVLSIGWVMRGRQWAYTNAWFWGTCALLLGLLLPLDGPAEGFLSAQYDRFSVVHVTLTAAVAVFWTLAARVDWPCRWYTRLGLGFCGAVGVAIVMWFMFPAFYQGPFGAMDPGLWPIYIENNKEWEPVLSGRNGYIGPFIANLLLPLVALILYAWRRRDNPAVIGLCALTHLWFTVLILLQIRWSSYLTLLNATALAMAVGQVFEHIGKLPPGRVGVASLKAATVLTAAIASVVLIGVGGALQPSSLETNADCRWQAAATALNKEAPGVLLTSLYWGPPLLWHTDFAVIATPMHRNDQGILYSHQIMTASDPAEAKRLLAQRDITHVVWCQDADWLPTVQPNSPGTFYADLQAAQIPDWLTMVPTESPGLKLARVHAVSP
jgi:hypothetical protein